MHNTHCDIPHTSDTNCYRHKDMPINKFKKYAFSFDIWSAAPCTGLLLLLLFLIRTSTHREHLYIFLRAILCVLNKLMCDEICED